MIQFNLLPDVKLAYIKAERQKRLVISISVIASIAAITLFLLLFTFASFVQKKSINDLTKDIDKSSKNLTGTEDLNKILTIQNQLTSLEQLHGQKVVATRLFGYIQQVTPAQASISSLNIDFAQNTLMISGQTPSQLATNTYADSLKFTTFSTKSGTSKAPAFSEVVLSSFSSAEGKASYSFAMKFDPKLFLQTEEVTLEVPKITSTRSNTELPGNALFQEDEEVQQ